MSLIANNPKYQALRAGLAALIADMDNTTLTEDNAQMAWESLIDRINALPFSDPFKRSELSPSIDGDYDDEYHQMSSKIRQMFDCLDKEMGKSDDTGHDD